MINFECKRDELTIRGRIFGDLSGKKEVVICSHPFVANQEMPKKYAEFLAEEGFIAVTYDFCGGGLGCSSDGRTVDMTVFTEKADLLAVVDYFKAQPYTESITLLGCSQGGFVSALVAAELKDEIKRLILMYPAICIPDDARKGDMLAYKFDPNNIPDVLGEVPMAVGGNYARVVMDMDAYEAISGYEGPVLLMHGTADKVVDISYSRKAKDYYPDCEYYEIADSDHGFTGQAAQEDFDHLKDFMAR